MGGGGEGERGSTQISLAKMLSLSHMASWAKMDREGAHIAS